jgi:hypothetical protein
MSIRTRSFHVFRLLGFALIGLLVIAALFVVRTSLEARTVQEAAAALTAADAAENNALPLAKADKLPPPDFVVRTPVVPVEPTPTNGNTQVTRTEGSKPEVSRSEGSKTEEVRTWHWRAGSKTIHKSTSIREQNR